MENLTNLKNQVRFEYFTSFDSNDSNLENYLKWWSDKTFIETRMLNKTVEFFKENLLYAIFVFDNESLIGAAGLIPCPNRHKEKMYYGDRLVVELASNFVDPKYRNYHIGTNFVLKRLDFCRQKKLFPVSVTGNHLIQKIFKHEGILMKDIEKYHHIYKEVRICECKENEKPSCKICPLTDKAIWVFKGF